MLKTVAFSALCLALVHTNCIASPADSKTLASVAASKQIYGKGVHNQCLPYALGLAQVFHDRYNVQRSASSTPGWCPAFPQLSADILSLLIPRKKLVFRNTGSLTMRLKYPSLVEGDNPIAWISAFNRNGTFTIDRILQLPLTNTSDREYIGGALMAGTFSR
jgi:hypothetical protein